MLERFIDLGCQENLTPSYVFDFKRDDCYNKCMSYLSILSLQLMQKALQL